MKDKYDKELNVGDRVAVAYRSGSRASIYSGTIITFKLKEYQTVGPVPVMVFLTDDEPLNKWYRQTEHLCEIPERIVKI